jgi:putative CocE/NonD family hydrolase
MAGPLRASLYVSTSGTDCDFVVKVIDVYPDTTKDNEPNPCKVRMGGYQQLVRGDIMRAKFREDYSNPKAMVPNKITEISIPLQDVFHTFKKGHRIMVQIQSSWFPLFDRNPQKFTDIYSAKEEDFQKALQKVYFNNQYPSQIRFSILKKKN